MASCYREQQEKKFQEIFFASVHQFNSISRDFSVYTNLLWLIISLLVFFMASILEVSENDSRKYRYITLQNDLSILLIEDAAAEKSSACCDVNVGSLADPDEAPGLAHFLEHMLFMGTSKYPIENEYSSFLNDHGGHSNAYTAQENTVYYFDVQSEFFEGALDRFAAFFTSPLFTESATLREISAVDSENAKNLQSDDWRIFQLLKSVSRPGHPFNNFSTGNLETLKILPESLGLDIREIMIQFYDKYYSASIMKVVLYSKESLDVLEQWAREKFSSVKNRSVTNFNAADMGAAFGPPELGRLLEVVPIRDVKDLDVCFPIPPVEALYRSKPVRYLSHLVGHESDGSILAALKAKGWANGLSSSTSVSQKDFAMFCVSVELTDLGVEHVDEIVACIFAYIGILHRSGPQEWIMREVKDIMAMDFRFLSKSAPWRYTTKLASNMQLYPPEHIITGANLMYDIDTTAVVPFLDRLVPSNCLVFTKHKNVKTQALQQGTALLKEKYYGTEYAVRQFSSEQQSLWSRALRCEENEVAERTGDVVSWALAQLHLPNPNPFVPTDFALRHASAPFVSSPFDDLSSTPVLVERREVISAAGKGADLFAPSTDEEPPASSLEGASSDSADIGDQDDEEEDGENATNEMPSSDISVEQEGKVLLGWFKQDGHWKLPKMNVQVLLETLLSACTPQATVLTEVFVDCLKELMTEYTYYADCAGLQFDASQTKGGIEFSFSGYNHKLSVLQNKVFAELVNLTKASMCSSDNEKKRFNDVFDRMKEKSLRSHANFRFWQPYYHCINGAANCLEEPRWTALEKHAALLNSSFSDFSSFASLFLKNVRIEVLIHGNSSAKEAREISEALTSVLGSAPLPPSLEAGRRIVRLQPGFEYVYRQHCRALNPAEKNSAIENSYFVGEIVGADVLPPGGVGDVADPAGGMEVEAVTELLVHLLSEPAFDQLRTKEQLGYIVHCSILKLGPSFGIQFIVQSSHKDPSYLDARVEAFLTSYRTVLAEMAVDTLNDNIDAVIKTLLEKPKNLNEETRRYWDEVKSGFYLFDRRARQAAKLLALKEAGSDAAVSTLLRYYDNFILSHETRTKFSSQCFGPNTKYPVATGTGVKRVIIDDHNVFRRSMPLGALRDCSKNYPVTNTIN